MSHYDNYTFLENIPTQTKDIVYYDVFSPKWTDFPFVDDTLEHTLSVSECDRFYLVSQFYYGTVEYSSTLFLINGLTDPFSLKPGIKLIIPTLEDLVRLKNKMLNPTSNVNNAIIE
jgi:hypothetical protein